MKKLLRLISVATMLLAATSFMACSSDDDDDSGARSASEHARGAIVGVVLDNRGEPVEGATVTLGNKTASTNRGGEFVLENVDVNDPKVKAIQTGIGSGSSTTTTTGSTTTITTAADSKLEPGAATAPTTSLSYAYTLSVTKDGYISGLVDGIYVTSAENIGGIEDARLSALRNEYAKILEEYAKAVGTSTALASTGDVIGATLRDTEDKSATMTTVAGALKEIQKLYSELGTTYSSTWASAKLIPLNASLKGTLKLNPSPATAEVFNATTYTPSKGTKVTVTYNRGTGYSNYTYKAETDENGNFSFEKLPSGVTLGLSVEGFTDKAGDVTAYFSTDVGPTVTTGTGNNATTSPKYHTNAAEILNNSSATLGSFTIDPNCLNVAGLDIMLFAQLEKIWVVNTNLLKNNDAALISVKDDITFEFNKEISRVSLGGSGFQDVTDKNYTVTIDATDAKKVTVKANDGVWTPAATEGGKIKLEVLAKDGTKELLNAEFQACFDTNIFVSITESSKNDKLLALSAPVVVTFSKPMSTASVSAKVAKTSGSDLANNFTKTWSEDGTTLTLTPTKFWDKVDSDDGAVIFTVTGVAKDETTTIKYWKTNSDNTTTGADGVDKFSGLKVYFDNYIDVTLAKVSDSKFTATFSKALKAIPAADLEKNFKVYYSATVTDAATSTAEVKDAKLSLDGSVLTVEAKNGDFENYGYYAVKLATTDVVGATGETNFRKSGDVKASTTKQFVADFTLGKEFKHAGVKIVDALPEGVNASRAVYADAAKWIEVTFTKDVAKSNLKVDNPVVNYIKGAVVYIPLAKLDDDKDVELSGIVTATNGEKAYYGEKKPSATTPEETLKTGYKVTKTTYKMVASSLYTQKASIAGGKNDATVTKIKPTDSVTFTFDQDVTGATWTAELYDQYNVGQKDLEQTLYKVNVAKAAADATAEAKKVITVSLAEGSKALVNDEKYLLSLKAVTGSGDTEIVRYDSNAFVTKETTAGVAGDKNYAWVDGGTEYTLGNKIVKSNADTGYTSIIPAQKKYIAIETEAADAKYENLYVVKAGKNSATTDFDEFMKSNTSSIVLEFNEDVTGFTAELATSDANWATKDDVVKANTYVSTAVPAGKVLTIKPTFAFPSGSNVYPIVFNAEGKKVALKDVAGKAFGYVNDSTTKHYTSLTFAGTGNEVKLDKVIAKTEAATASPLALTLIDTADTANGQNLTFSFNANISKTSADYGTYKLYRKVVSAVPDSDKWEPVKNGSGDVIEFKLASHNIYYVDDVQKKAGSKYAEIADFAIRKLTPCISVNAGANEFDYAKDSYYKLVQTVDNVDIYSDAVKVTENAVIFPTITLGITTPTDEFNETPITTDAKTVNIPMTAYLKSVSATGVKGSGKATDLGENSVLKAGKVSASVGSDGKSIDLKIVKDATAAKGNQIRITVTNVNGLEVSTTIDVK
ncbi:carboxypeptidase regulatory-like domain-containing protein [Treponema ruminis]|uniref:Carboxypeptidase regulatory-like domain-containing protein n=1 Tax=Treponema ruminis TaxID=744515 RepID=A0A7W8GAU1_9SPIR|nr:carboxypeptidase-like regulatory domain-containing protein [Treponema ruminis]MBB5227049.1 hypothetical protein [Treponema ruminis]QSI01476.1 carboxypeptidase regulatory-like domain-containing protein [Treponema ruminis]